MADIFVTENARELLQNKFVLLLGDSNMRATYKDLILLISRNEILSLRHLQKRGEESYEGDKRVLFRGLIRGRQYEEGRIFSKFNVHLEYHFIARCYTPQLENIFHKIKNHEMKTPNVIIMNSCVWDISRWGPNGVDAYKDNMQKLMILLKGCIPKETLFIWTTALPVSTEIRGGLLIKQLNFMQDLLRFEVMEANLFCRQLVVSHGYDVLDTHYHLRMQVHRRMKDGIHYGPLPIRFVTNLILTHISLSWNVPLPGHITGVALQRIITNGVRHIATDENVVLPTLPISLSNKKESTENQGTVAKKNNFKRSTRRGGPYNKGRGPPPTWRETEAQVWQKDVPHVWQNDEVWAGIRPKPSQPPRYAQVPPSNNYWNDPVYSSQQDYARSNYANFERAGPVRKPNKFQTSRHRPY